MLEEPLLEHWKALTPFQLRAETRADRLEIEFERRNTALFSQWDIVKTRAKIQSRSGMEYNFSSPPLLPEEKLPITAVRNSILSPGKLRGVDDLESQRGLTKSWCKDRGNRTGNFKVPLGTSGAWSVMKGLNASLTYQKRRFLRAWHPCLWYFVYDHCHHEFNHKLNFYFSYGKTKGRKGKFWNFVLFRYILNHAEM